uniref:Uncharacterized protein n=1 Tax=Anopheles darlingi TaxID=43151 RepID=A0A2M4DPW2_ANODA
MTIVVGVGFSCCYYLCLWVAAAAVVGSVCGVCRFEGSHSSLALIALAHHHYHRHHHHHPYHHHHHYPHHRRHRFGSISLCLFLSRSLSFWYGPAIIVRLVHCVYDSQSVLISGFVAATDAAAAAAAALPLHWRSTTDAHHRRFWSYCCCCCWVVCLVPLRECDTVCCDAELP